MAASASLYVAPSRWSLNDLSSELIALIFVQLRDLDARSIAAARCLSRRLEAIATPITYQTLSLTERIVAPDAGKLFPNLLRNIANHTNHVIATSGLDPGGIRRVLDGIRRLCSVHWRYVDAEFQSQSFWLPSDVLSPSHARFSKTKLYVEDLPLRDFTGDLRDTYVRAIPADFLVSLKLASPAPPLSTRLDSLKRLLMQSHRLEVFHYEDRGQGTRFSFVGKERMPAFTGLALKSYDWNHSPEEVRRHWDFSRLKSLRLVSVPIFNFLSSVNFCDFAGLRHLVCEDWSAHLPDQRQEATCNLYLLVRWYVHSLRTLAITCHTHQFPLDAILTHGPSLRELRFRDHVGFGEEDRRCPTLRPADLALLAQALPNVHTLELDMDIAQCDPVEFLAAVCSFKSLHTLTLHVQTVLHPLQEVHPGTDRDRDAALRTFAFLVRRRRECGGCFRSVTINVGGWRRVMVRRLGEAWRRQNEMGVFAERCFVLQRVEGSGEMVVGEERGVEGSGY